MKLYNTIKTTSLLVSVALLANSCTKDFETLNTAPNLISEELVTPEFLLSGVQYGAGRGLNASDAGNYCGMDVSVANRPFIDNFDDGAWNLNYTSFSNNLAAIIRKTAGKPELVNKKAIARIMKAWLNAQATDIYGDIPYFEANKSVEEAIPNPKYDLQKNIYLDLFKELKEASAELDATKPSYGSADFYYAGNVSKWKKFANSLRLRLALRVRYVDLQMAKDNMSDLKESDLITSRADDAAIFTNTDMDAYRNPMYNELLRYPDRVFAGYLVGKPLLDALLTGSSSPRNPLDPRTKVIADTAAAAWPASKGLPYFGFRAQPLLGDVPVENKYPYGFGSTSTFSLFLYSPVIEKSVLKSSEVYFALAEAALFNIKAGNANDYFKKGIQASIIEVQDLYNKGKNQVADVASKIVPNPNLDIPAFLAYKEMKQSEIDAFLASSVVTLTGTDEEKLEQIMNQKLIALFPNALEGWSEWRRTGYPRVLVSSNEQSSLHGVSPRRKHYPQSERLINSANFQEAVSRLGGTDDLLKKVWWDANPAAPRKHPGIVETRSAPWLE